ncbi:NADP-dependent oxidoreductase domain-containing protein [Bisporella sp. PMI_857]|nr:NADP-dependent oxidoreductase domain-containing protein [Bisporella sp. PMI_857]
MSAQIPMRQLGKNEPMVLALGFGTVGVSIAYSRPPPDGQRFAPLDGAFTLGLAFWDSADVYTNNEDLLIAYIATGTWVTNSLPEYCKAAIEKSLKRLGVDTIDLHYCHRVNGITPIEHTVAAMAELFRREGKAKYIGLSEVSAGTPWQADKVYSITAVQMEYSPFCLEVESSNTKLLETCRGLGVAMVAYSPLGCGFFTGRYTSLGDFKDGDCRHFMPPFSPENFPKNLEVVNALKKVADQKRYDVFPIPGTNKQKYLLENFGSLEILLNNAKVHGCGHVELPSMRMFADTVPLEAGN